MRNFYVLFFSFILSLQNPVCTSSTAQFRLAAFSSALQLHVTAGYRHGKRRSRLRQSWSRGCSDFRAREDGGLKEGDEQQELTGERIWRKNPQGLVTGCPGSDRLFSPSGQFSVLVFPDTAAAFKVVEHFPLATVPLLDFKHTALSHFSFCLAGSSFSVLLFLPHLSAL